MHNQQPIMLVKICGLTTIEHARSAADAGADLLGFVFAPSQRQVTVEQAAAIVAGLGDRSVRTVGVFVNTPVATINATLAAAGLDFAQLSGDEMVADAAGIDWPVIKALRLDGSERERAWVEGTGAALLLVDANVPGSYGGAGVLADWQAAAMLAQQRRVLLAGGLRPENVGDAVARVRPYGVDVSSGVETNGVKDVARIQAFITAARSAH